MSYTVTTTTNSIQKEQSILYEQFGAPALIYRSNNSSAWSATPTTRAVQQNHELHGNCLQIMNVKNKDEHTYYAIRPIGLNKQHMALSKIMLPYNNNNMHHKDNSNTSTDIDLEVPIRQIVQCGGGQHQQDASTRWFMARTFTHCSVLRVNITNEDEDYHENVHHHGISGTSTSSSIGATIEEVTRIYFNNDTNNNNNNSSISKVFCNTGDVPRCCTGGYHDALSSCYFSLPPMFAIGGYKNTIQQVIVGASTTIQSLTFKNICSQKMIEHSLHPMILWSSAYSSSSSDFGNSLFSLDLRTCAATKVWSPSHANYMVNGMCSIRSFLQHPTRQYTAYATSSLRKLYELDIRMPTKHVLSWTLTAEVDAFVEGDDILALAETGPSQNEHSLFDNNDNDNNVSSASISNSTLSSSSSSSTTILAIQKAPLAYGLRLYQSPLQSPRFGTIPLESGPYGGVSSPNSCIATSTVYPLIECSSNVFYCGLASIRVPTSKLLPPQRMKNDDDEEVESISNITNSCISTDNATCVLLLTSMGDIHCHALMECNQDDRRQSYAFKSLPHGMSAIPVPQVYVSPDKNTNNEDNNTQFLPIYLTNKYPISNSAILQHNFSFMDTDRYKMVPISAIHAISNDNNDNDNDGITNEKKIEASWSSSSSRSSSGSSSSSSSSNRSDEESVFMNDDLNIPQREIMKSIKKLLTDQPRAHWEIQRYSDTPEENVKDIIRNAAFTESEEGQFYFGTSNTRTNTNLVEFEKHATGGIVPARTIVPTAEDATHYFVPSTVATVSFLEGPAKKIKLPELNNPKPSSDVSKKKIMQLEQRWCD